MEGYTIFPLRPIPGACLFTTRATTCRARSTALFLRGYGITSSRSEAEVHYRFENFATNLLVAEGTGRPDAEPFDDVALVHS